MGWSTSYRVGGYTRADMGGVVRHLCRDVEEEHENLRRQHSNELIDPARTHQNRSLISVGSGNFRPAKSVQEVLDVIDARLSTVQNWRVKKDGTRVPVKVRKDAVVLQEHLFQLDPEFTGPASEMTPEKLAEVRRLHAVFMRDVIKRHGVENVLFASEHLDETSPHFSALVVPITPDGELSAKFHTTGKKNPTRSEAQAAYRKRHDDLRKVLRVEGYDATFERVSDGAKGAPLATVKRMAKRATKVERKQLEDKSAETAMQGHIVAGKTQKLEKDRAALAAKQAELDEREEKLDEREEKLAADAKNVRASAERVSEIEHLPVEAKQELKDIGGAMSSYLASRGLKPTGTPSTPALITNPDA